MDVHPLQLNLGAVGGHLEVDRQLPDGILPPRRTSIEETHHGSLQKVLVIVDLFATAWTIAPTLFLRSFFVGIDRKTMTMSRE
jgi:hypothetical protein